jgi:hypothetical protein
VDAFSRVVLPLLAEPRLDGVSRGVFVIVAFEGELRVAVGLDRSDFAPFDLLLL